MDAHLPFTKRCVFLCRQEDHHIRDARTCSTQKIGLGFFRVCQKDFEPYAHNKLSIKMYFIWNGKKRDEYREVFAGWAFPERALYFD